MRVSPGSFAWLGHAWAGMASAVICYAEYLGLGAVLAPALLGYGDQSKSAATLLVVFSACVACLLLSLRGIPFLAGPRGASLSVLVMALPWLQAHFSTTAHQQLLLLLCLMLGCATMLLLASTHWVQQIFSSLPAWLMPSFIYASAVGIAAGAVSKYLYACLQVAPWQTWAIFFSATLVGIFWPIVCRKIIAHLQSRSPTLARLVAPLQGLTLIVAASLTWVAYEFSALNPSQGGRCARLGRVELDLPMLTERFQSLMQHLGSDLGWLALASAFVFGLAVGCVAAIETRTTLDSVHEIASKLNSAPSSPSAMLRFNAASNLLLGASTTVGSSLSQSRTLLLWSMSRPSPWAVFMHALALACIALLLSPWLAHLPQLALAVLMTLVATQMISQSCTNIWKNAYDPSATSSQGLRAGLGLWLVLGITAVTGQVILAFVIPAVVFGVARWWCARRIQPKK